MKITASIIFSTISFTLLMVIAPAIVGNLICKKNTTVLDKSRAYSFIAGFFSMLGIWAVMVLPFSLFVPNHPFHEIRYAYLGVILMICLTDILYGLKQRSVFVEDSSPEQKFTIDLKPIIYGISKRIRSLICSTPDRIYLIVFLAVMVFQIFETLYFAPVGYVNDDLYYYNHINDTVYMDQLYARMANGAIPEADKASIIYTTGYKLIVNQWFSFISFLSATTGIHTLVLCRTIIPAYIIVLLYITIYAFGAFVFPDSRQKRMCFLMSSALIVEILSYSYYLFFLTLYITTYGKQIAGIIGVPFLLLSLYACVTNMNGDQRSRIFDWILLFLVSSGVVSMGVSALSSGALALVFMSAVLFFKYRNVKTLTCIVSVAIPFLIQLLTFVSIGGKAIVILSPK